MRPAIRRLLGVCACMLGWSVAPLSRAIEPQARALVSLQAESSIPARLEFRGGVPLDASFDVPARGASPAARALDFVARYAEIFRLRAGNSALVPQRTTRDELGDVVRLYQTWKGVPVFASQLVVGLTDERTGPRVRFARGALMSDRGEVTLDPDPSLPASVAEENARSHLGRRGAAILGQTRLWVHDPSLFGEPGGPQLVWGVTVEDEPPVQVLVDAHDGSVAFEHALAAADTGLGSYKASFFSFADEDKICSDPPTCSTYQIPVVATHSGIDPNWAADLEVVLAWWYLRGTWAFFHDGFGRHSWDGKSDSVRVDVHDNVPNAEYIWDTISFRDGWLSYDVMAHEFTHGVIDYSSNLIYKHESGALNESYADVMGALVDSADWLHAEDRSSGEGPTRDLANPPAFGQPDRYANRCIPSNDYCSYAADHGGVHTNSGIANKAHYLMAEGGTHNGRSVSGMGRAKLGRLAYHVMTTLPPTADLLAARHYSVSTAIQLVFFGVGGFTAADVCTVRNAWGAVELGDGDLDCDGSTDGWDDSDGDQIKDASDNCPTVKNPSQLDWNQDGLGDACQDSDGDGVDDAVDNCPAVDNPWPQPDLDHDGQGDACDPDDDADGVADASDNCPLDANPTQTDTNGNGQGDACDQDGDLDGVFTSDGDNCPFTPNADQADSDEDGLGDACDGCPDVPDNALVWVAGIPEFGIPPHPFQPDSDGDGTPDACDPVAFGVVALALGGLPFNPTHPILPDGLVRSGSIEGTGGSGFRIPLPGCDFDAPLAGNEALELVFEDLPPSVSVWIEDDLGARLAEIVDPEPAGGPRGLRFVPDCVRAHALHFALAPDFGGAGFVVSLTAVDAGGPDPWIAPYPVLDSPPPIADGDGDGLPDAIDRCLHWFDPTHADVDGDGTGDACTCGDMAGGGRVGSDDVSALRAALSGARFGVPHPEKCNVIGPLDPADADGDGLANECNLVDLVVVRRSLAVLAPSIAPVCDAALP